MYESAKILKNNDGSYAVIIDGVAVHGSVTYSEAIAALENFLALGGESDA